MTVRFVRHLALLHVSAGQLERLLRLPADVTVRGFTLDHLRDAAIFVLESGRFAPVVECAEPPALIGKVESEVTDDGAVTQRVTWEGLEGAEVITRRGGDTYRTRPMRVRARQWLGDNTADILALGATFHEIEESDRALLDDPDATGSLLTSPNSVWAEVRDGDWVVQRGDGFTRMTDEEFVAEYEPAP
jgi:hypothetical protein